MSSNLQNAAAKAVMKQHSCSFYDSFHFTKSNPVLISFQKEKRNFIGFVTDKKKTNACLSPGFHGRMTMMLYEVWNKYKPLLPQEYYWQHLLEMGDFLVQQKEYSLALSLCFDRFLLEINLKNYNLKKNIYELNEYQNWHFPNGLQTDTAILTIQSLIGKYFCSYQCVKLNNPMLTCGKALDQCLNILSLFRTLTQLLLLQENCCGLLYNCSISIYTICREMMLLGHSAKVLEFFVWICMCLESSLPLLAVKFLTWRSTLYMAVCQCYWDSNSGQQAEAFARRALCKINDLWHIEKLKEDGQVLQKEVNSAFRESTLKMALIIFKRAVFESRKKHRSTLRAKNRFNIKDYINLAWPRTPTEKLIVEMFDSVSAQFMAILECLTNQRQRIVQTNGCSQWEVELIDAVTELFYAAKEILLGNAVLNITGKKSKKDQPVVGFSNLIDNEQSTLMDLATAGDNRIPVSAVFQLARLAFCYEQFEAFAFLAEPLKHTEDGVYLRNIFVINFKQAVTNQQYGWDVKSLEILSAIERLVSGRKRRKSQSTSPPTAAATTTAIATTTTTTAVAPTAAPTTTAATTTAAPTATTTAATTATTVDEETSKTDMVGTAIKTNGDELMHLAQVLKSVLMEKFILQKVDLDLIADAALLLWNKSKIIIQRHQIGLGYKTKYFQKPENQNKWLQILDVTLHIMSWCQMAKIAPSVLIEVAMRFALLLETSAGTTTPQKMTENTGGSLKDSPCLSYSSDEDLSSSSSYSLTKDFMGKTKNEMLHIAQSLLEDVLEQVARGRNTDERHIADVSWIMQQSDELCGKSQSDEECNGSPSMANNMFGHQKLTESTIRCQHTELIFIYFRVICTIKNLEIMHIKASMNKPFKRVDPQSVVNCAQVLEKLQVECGANNLQKSLLYMQASISLRTYSQQERKQMLEQSLKFLEKFQNEELKIFETNTGALKNANPEKRKVPPAPILVHRSGSKMVFKPAPFISADGESICWYRLFAHFIKSSNPKVRLNDMSVAGTGELVSSDCDELTVTGLNLNHRYIFALAAYTPDGKMVGGGIGESTKPILAMNPLSVPMTYSFLCQTAYQLGVDSISQKAFNFLWTHFVKTDKSKQSSDCFIDSAFHQFKINRPKLNKQILTSTAVSPLFMRQMYSCVMAQVDTSIQKKGLVCNKLCSQGPFVDGQINRLKECEKLLMAMEISGWLNDYKLCLQAIVQCYGLLVPLLYHRVAVIPVAQVLLQCIVSLQELPVSIRQKRPSSTADSLHHMAAVMAYHAAKMLFEFNEKSLSLHVYEAGLTTLHQNLIAKKSTIHDSNLSSSVYTGLVSEEQIPPDFKVQQQVHLPSSKHPSKKASIWGLTKQDYSLDVSNEELTTLEIAMHLTSKQLSSDNDHQYENQRLALADIYFFPSTLSAKEVNKFKKRACYSEQLLRVIEKAVSEGNHSFAYGLAEDLYSFIKRKNEANFGTKYRKTAKKGKTAIESMSVDDMQRYAATVVEYGKVESGQKSSDKTAKKQKKENTSPEKKPSETTAKKNKKESPQPKQKSPEKIDKFNRKKKRRLFPNDTLEVEQAKIEAMSVLAHHINTIYPRNKLRKACRKSMAEEFSLQSQLLMFMGLSQFNIFIEKMETIRRIQPTVPLMNYGTYHDDNWFSYETTGMLLLIENKERKKKLFVEKKGFFLKSPTTQGGIPPESLQGIENNSDEIQDILRRVLSCLQKSLVFAHRGKMWSLLQNNAKILWDVVQTMQYQLVSVNSKASKECIYISLKTYNSLVYPALVLASDLLLDMLKKLQESENNGTDKEKQETQIYYESVFGGIENVNGGSLLSFEPFLDDSTIVDVRLVQRVCMKAIKIIHSQKKWEHLADLVLRFNAITNERFAEFTLPFLIDAQNNLLNLLKEMNINSPGLQPQLKTLTSKEYLNTQLKISTDKVKSINISPESRLDIYSSEIYKENEGCQHISVPLDVDYTWKCLETFSNATNYGARALNHSRRLLGLYIIGQQQLKYEDITGEEKIIKPFFLSMKLLEPLPQFGADNFHGETYNQFTSRNSMDQLENVIASYSQTTDLLLNKLETDLAAQAFTELGNVYFIAGNRRMAYKTWKKSLKVILGLNGQPVLNWKNCYTNEDASLQLLQNCGIWGCLHGGIVASNIARYSVSNDWMLSLQYCLLAYNLFKAVFRCSVQHPQSDRQYAMYEMGEGCSVTHLVPGVQLLTDQYRCNTRQLLSSLEFVISKLNLYEHYLKNLPLLALHLYFSRSLCRDVKLCVQGQIQKILTLTNLHLFSEAIKTLMQLLNGERLPQLGSTHFRLVEAQIDSVEFDTSIPCTEMTNFKILEMLTEKQLSVELSVFYGHFLSYELILAHVHLLVTMADCLNVIPDKKEKESTVVNNPVAVESSEVLILDDDSPPTFPRDVLRHEKLVPIEKVKHQLLVSATEKLDNLMEKLKQKPGYTSYKLKTKDLDVVVRCFVEQSRISLQKQKSYFAAKFCFDALNRLQQSNIFSTQEKSQTPKKKIKRLSVAVREKIEAESVRKSKQNQIFRNSETNPEHIGCQQWLQCRLHFVHALLTDVSIPNTWLELGEPLVSEFSSFENLCKSGQQESQTWNNPEMEAAFIYMRVLKMLSLTHCDKACVPLLKEGISLLQSCPELSYSGSLNLIAFRLLKTDLQIGATGPLTVSMVKETLKSYLEIQEFAEKLLKELGERTQHTLTTNQEPISCPVLPLKNIYLSPLNILVQVKLRISLMMVKLHLKPINLSTTVELQKRDSHLVDCLAVVKNALYLNRNSIFWNAGLEVEILLLIGKLQREMSKLEMVPFFTSMSSFLDAIKVSFFAQHSHVFMKTAFLEIALIAVSQTKKQESFVCQKTKEKNNSSESIHFSILGPTEEKQLSMIAWLAVRTAAIITFCRNNMTLMGQPTHVGTQYKLLPEANNHAPEFLNFDLFSKYLFGKKKKIYKNEFEEEYEQMVEARMSENKSSKQECANEVKEFAINNNTWSYVLSYSAHLFEQLHRTMVSINRTLQTEEDVEASSKQSQTTFHQSFLCSLSLMNNEQLRYASTYSFLMHNFSMFCQQCAISYPHSQLEELIEDGKAQDPSATPPFASVERFSEFHSRRILPAEFQKRELLTFPEQKLVWPNANEVTFQWYSPSFDNIVTALHRDTTPIYLLCTASKKGKSGELHCFVDYLLFPQYFVTDIYKRIKQIIHLKDVHQKSTQVMHTSKHAATVRRTKSLNETSTEGDAELQESVTYFHCMDVQRKQKPHDIIIPSLDRTDTTLRFYPKDEEDIF